MFDERRHSTSRLRAYDSVLDHEDGNPLSPSHFKIKVFNQNRRGHFYLQTSILDREDSLPRSRGERSQAIEYNTNYFHNGSYIDVYFRHGGGQEMGDIRIDKYPLSLVSEPAY
jgi:hypothetical protein